MRRLRFRNLMGATRNGWSVVREAGASILAYELYPLGIATPSLPVVPRLWRGARPAEIPVLFIHGLLHNGSTFAWIRQKMALAGWRHLRAVNFSTTQHSIPEMAEQAFETIEKMKREYGVPHIDIVSHSMGGILARYVAQVMKHDTSIRRLVTLGTPHQGTELSRFSWSPHLRELAPGSATIEDLRRAPALTHTQAIAVTGNLDVLLWPRHCGRWEGVRNITLQGVGHAGLLFSKRVIQIIAAHLRPESAV